MFGLYASSHLVHSVLLELPAVVAAAVRSTGHSSLGSTGYSCSQAGHTAAGSLGTVGHVLGMGMLGVELVGIRIALTHNHIRAHLDMQWQALGPAMAVELVGYTLSSNYETY